MVTQMRMPTVWRRRQRRRRLAVSFAENHSRSCLRLRFIPKNIKTKICIHVRNVGGATNICRCLIITSRCITLSCGIATSAGRPLRTRSDFSRTWKSTAGTRSRNGTSVRNAGRLLLHGQSLYATCVCIPAKGLSVATFVGVVLTTDPICSSMRVSTRARNPTRVRCAGNASRVRTTSIAIKWFTAGSNHTRASSVGKRSARNQSWTDTSRRTTCPVFVRNHTCVRHVAKVSGKSLN